MIAPVRTWLPLAIWTTLILLTSSDLFSSSHSGSILALLLCRILSPAHVETINFIFRKTMHLTGYAIEGALGFRAARGHRSGFALRWAIAGVAIAVAVASIDEWHQTFVPSRGGSPQDVLLDGCGAVLAQLFFAARNLRK